MGERLLALAWVIGVFSLGLKDLVDLLVRTLGWNCTENLRFVEK